MKYLLFSVFYSCHLLVAEAAVKDTIPVNQKDVESIQATINSLYDVISGPAGQTRNWDRMRSLFAPEARLIPTGKRQDGSFGKRVMSVEDYIKLSGPVLEKDGFFEKEIASKTEQYGAIVHVFSTYESRRNLNDPAPFIRGINSIQLWNDGKRWWIITIFWQGETTDNPIPAKYLEQP